MAIQFASLNADSPLKELKAFAAQEPSCSSVLLVTGGHAGRTKAAVFDDIDAAYRAKLVSDAGFRTPTKQGGGGGCTFGQAARELDFAALSESSPLAELKDYVERNSLNVLTVCDGHSGRTRKEIYAELAALQDAPSPPKHGSKVGGGGAVALAFGDLSPSSPATELKAFCKQEALDVVCVTGGRAARTLASIYDEIDAAVNERPPPPSTISAQQMDLVAPAPVQEESPEYYKRAIAKARKNAAKQGSGFSTPTKQGGADFSALSADSPLKELKDYVERNSLDVLTVCSGHSSRTRKDIYAEIAALQSKMDVVADMELEDFKRLVEAKTSKKLALGSLSPASPLKELKTFIRSHKLTDRVNSDIGGHDSRTKKDIYADICVVTANSQYEHTACRTGGMPSVTAGKLKEKTQKSATKGGAKAKVKQARNADGTFAADDGDL